MVGLSGISDSRDAHIVNKSFMENREQQILSEIKAMMGSIRSQLELLDAKMAELQQCVDPEDFDNNPIELDIDFSEENVPVAQIIADDEDLPFDDLPEDIEPETAYEPAVEPQEQESEPESEPEPEPEPESVPETVQTPEPVSEPDQDDDDDLPGVFDQPLPLYAAAQSSPKVKPSVAETMADSRPWRTDMPGTPVKDVRSAISLNDRIIFINQLFNEDPVRFQEVISRINLMDDLDQVVEYLSAENPEWNFSSELVYRFMMAVRRKVK